MSRTNKGGKPLGWEYWGKRKGGSWVDRETLNNMLVCLDDLED